jgi:hypothetical protein
MVWKLVAERFAASRNALTGFEPVVEIHIEGEQEPVAVSKVEIRRGSPWVVLLAVPADKVPPTVGWPVFVREDRIRRIEIAFNRAGRVPIGFEVEEIESDVPPLVEVA